jgi:g-D-glutamyl-meso-diaminopimelate peptidase
LIIPLIILLAYSLQVQEYIKPFVKTDNDNEKEGNQSMTSEPQVTPAQLNIPDSMIGESGLYRITANEYLSLRNTPDKKGERLAKLPAGEVVKVLKRVGCYYKVQSDSLTGYVLSGYLEPTLKDKDLEKLTIVDTTEYKYSYDEMLLDIKQIDKRYGEYMTINNIGFSYDGREIKVIVVGNDDARVNVLIHAGIHGREHMSVMLVMKQLEYYLDKKSQDMDERWLRDVRFHIVPMLNPDGVMISQLGLDAIRDTDLRKGLEVIRRNDIEKGIELEEDEYYTQWKDNARGVDINLNFAANRVNIELSKRPSYAKFKGQSIESELETQAIVAYTKKYDFDATLSYHAYGSGYYWYFGQTGRLKKDNEELGKAIENVSGYIPLEHNDGATNGGGGYKDWAIESLGISSLTLEIGSTQCPLLLREWPTVWERNKEVWKAAEWALDNNK